MDTTSLDQIYDVLVIGGGPVGLNAAYEVAKAGKTVVVLEKLNFFNNAGSSGDLTRMYRTMYTEDFMADLAYSSLGIWNELEKDAGDSLRLMSGLLNFGDPTYNSGGPMGTLLDPIENLDRLRMAYRKLTKAQIEAEFPFTNLPSDFEGVFAPDNGIINVPLFVRTLYRLAQSYGAFLHQFSPVSKVEPCMIGARKIWKVVSIKHDKVVTYHAEKLIMASGAYSNHILVPSFGFHLALDIWESISTSFSVNSGPNGTVFPCMWIQFAKNVGTESRLFYGFPAVQWGPPNVAKISVDDATRKIKDPSQRRANVVNSDDVANVQRYVEGHIKGVDGTVPASSSTCLQTNVYDNMFVLDFIPEKYLCGGAKDSVAIFTAGWAMKFVPLIGRALKQMVLDGETEFPISEFKITRKDPKAPGIIVDGPVVLDSVHMTETLRSYVKL